jgi:hypothetical protein
MSAGHGSTIDLGIGLLVAALCLTASLPWWHAARLGRRRAEGVAHGRPIVAGTGKPVGGQSDPDVSVLLELLTAALRAGAGIPRALGATGSAVGGDDGRALGRVADALRLGADWDTAWHGAPRGLEPVRRGLRSAWVDGAAPGEALRVAAEELVHERRSASRTAAARLGVRLVLPLGACFLPAFVLIGLVPVLLALGVDLLSG